MMDVLIFYLEYYTSKSLKHASIYLTSRLDNHRSFTGRFNFHFVGDCARQGQHNYSDGSYRIVLFKIYRRLLLRYIGDCANQLQHIDAEICWLGKEIFLPDVTFGNWPHLFLVLSGKNSLFRILRSSSYLEKDPFVLVTGIV